MRFILILALLISSVSAYSQLKHPVSIVELICNPDKYDGKQVQIIGYLNLEFEGDAIYLHKEDYEHSIMQNGLWIEEPKKEAFMGDKGFMNKKYVIIEGKFKKDNKGHLGLWSGAIEKITRIQEWK